MSAGNFCSDKGLGNAAAETEFAGIRFGSESPPSTSARIAQASAECRGNAAGGGLSSKPGKCQRCGHAYHSNGKRMDIHWSAAAQAWVCKRCYSQDPQVYP